MLVPLEKPNFDVHFADEEKVDIKPFISSLDKVERKLEELKQMKRSLISTGGEEQKVYGVMKSIRNSVGWILFESKHLQEMLDNFLR